MSYSKYFRSSNIPQTQPIPGQNMEKNNAGGYSYVVSDWDRLQRFLILGSEGNTYYVSEKKMTLDNAKCVERCLAEDGKRVVDMICEISDQGRAAKNTPAIFALAMAASYGLEKINPIKRTEKAEKGKNKKAKISDTNNSEYNNACETRKYALEAFSSRKVVRTGTHLFEFAQFVNTFRGWGPSLHNAFMNWYHSMPISELSYQIVKYPSRITEEGSPSSRWSHRDILRKRLGASKEKNRNAAFDYAVHGTENLWKNTGWANKGKAKDDLKPIIGDIKIRDAKDASEVSSIISEYGLPHECVPTQYKKDHSVLESLLPNMPLHALVRNLGSMTANGFLQPLSKQVSYIVETLKNEKYIHKSRMHPITLLSAIKVYSSGRGMKGSLTWTPIGNIVDALNDAMYMSFDNVEPTNKNIFLALDVSGSMGGSIVCGMEHITAREAVACMSLATAKTEKNYHIMGFSTNFVNLNISPKQRIDQVCHYMSSMPFGGTDCSLPMVYALEKKMDVDTFIIYTDNETYAGVKHPSECLKEYRKKINPRAKMIVVATSATEFSIGCDNDPLVLQVAGFDSAAPAIISDFIRNN